MTDHIQRSMEHQEALSKIPFNKRIALAKESLEKQLAAFTDAKAKLHAKITELDLALARTEGSLDGLKQFISMLEEEKDNEEVIVVGADEKPQARVGEVSDLS